MTKEEAEQLTLSELMDAFSDLIREMEYRADTTDETQGEWFLPVHTMIPEIRKRRKPDESE